jgi:hypothetical protein
VKEHKVTENAIAPKGGAGKNYQPSRLFDNENSARYSWYTAAVARQVHKAAPKEVQPLRIRGWERWARTAAAAAAETYANTSEIKARVAAGVRRVRNTGESAAKDTWTRRSPLWVER